MSNGADSKTAAAPAAAPAPAPAAAASESGDGSSVTTTPASTASTATPKSKKKAMLCANCRNEGAKLRCTVCKKVAYCNRNCQKSDWRFHKRICKKPEKKKNNTTKKSGSGNSNSSSNSSTAAAAPSSKPTPKKTKAAAEPTQAELDAEDEEIVKSLKGYRYFHRDVSEHEAKIIGDITPERLDPAAAAAATAADDDDDAPQPIAAGANSTPTLAKASAWNSARTFEERDMTRWAKSHLESLLIDMSEAVADAQAVITELTDWEGDASIPVIRGRARFIYDLHFSAKVEIKVPDNDTAKKATIKIRDLSHDEDEPRFELSFQSPKPSSLHQAAFRSIMDTSSGTMRTRLMAALQQFVTDFKAK